jgi:hypothetical protein
MSQQTGFGDQRARFGSHVLPANRCIRPTQSGTCACLVMKGPGVRVPPSASQSPCILAGFGAARWIVIGVDEADWAMRHVGGGSLVRFGLDRRRAWVRANGRPRSSGSRGEASRIRLLDLDQATRLAPGSTGATGAASCAARVGSIPSPLAVARRRLASSVCAELGRRRCGPAGGGASASVWCRASLRARSLPGVNQRRLSILRLARLAAVLALHGVLLRARRL